MSEQGGTGVSEAGPSRLERFSRNERRIVEEGYPFLALWMAPAVALVLLRYELVSVPFWLLTLFTAYFFRNPRREIPAHKGAIVSPADGRVVGVEEFEDERFELGRTRRLSIFMSPFDVHINRAPVEGQVIRTVYNPGKYFAATNDKASLLNEQNALILDAAHGPRMAIVQIAGFIARRIVCYAGPGDHLARGARFGLIRFGSRVDLYLPLATHVVVGPGDRVKGGETIVGYLS